jgi:hypothetical protein
MVPLMPTASWLRFCMALSRHFVFNRHKLMYIMEQERTLAADRLYPLGLLSLWPSARTLKPGLSVAGQAQPILAWPSDKPITSDI